MSPGHLSPDYFPGQFPGKGQGISKSSSSWSWIFQKLEMPEDGGDLLGPGSWNYCIPGVGLNGTIQSISPKKLSQKSTHSSQENSLLPASCAALLPLERSTHWSWTGKSSRIHNSWCCTIPAFPRLLPPWMLFHLSMRKKGRSFSFQHPCRTFQGQQIPHGLEIPALPKNNPWLLFPGESVENMTIPDNSPWKTVSFPAPHVFQPSPRGFLSWSPDLERRHLTQL